MTPWRPRWAGYAPCDQCGAPAGTICLAIRGANGRKRGQPKEGRPHPGRRLINARRGRYVDTEIAEIRLKVWRRRALVGDRVADIAAELRMSRSALDRYVVRARRRGNPDAVYHALAGR